MGVCGCVSLKFYYIKEKKNHQLRQIPYIMCPSKLNSIYAIQAFQIIEITFKGGIDSIRVMNKQMVSICFTNFIYDVIKW